MSEVSGPMRGIGRFDSDWTTVIDHGMNASTFTARVIASTQSDTYSADAGAIGALKGSLHGGAPGPVLDMLVEIGTIDRAETRLRHEVVAGKRIMGFGHRIYKVRDPRADVLSRFPTPCVQPVRTAPGLASRLGQALRPAGTD